MTTPTIRDIRHLRTPLPEPKLSGLITASIVILVLAFNFIIALAVCVNALSP